jgi:hypothetical protein
MTGNNDDDKCMHDERTMCAAAIKADFRSNQWTMLAKAVISFYLPALVTVSVVLEVFSNPLVDAC